MGRWKLVEWFEDGAYELYELGTDPGERVNLAVAEPERAADLLDRLQSWREEVGANMPREDAGE
jgi:hypothetical protein